jgi:membrane-bound serine protease (ClpP class)
MFARAARAVAALGLILLGTVLYAEDEPAASADTADADTAAASQNLSIDEAESALVHVLHWDDAVTPVTSRFFAERLEEAAEAGADAVLIELDTPGGLLDATRDIVTDFLDAEIPIIVWVGPAGARAASAGTFITMAAHVAAMSPGSNIGAASPVTMTGGGQDSTMSSKMMNDTAAFARTVAERRGRNAEWAEQAVRDAASITETEAVELNVVDFVAKTREDVLEQASGRMIELADRDHVLRLDNAEIVEKDLGFRYRLLSLLANPNVATILLMLGIYGIFFELSNPGSVLPGVVGVIFLILAFFSMQTLPMNLAGILLVVTGLILFILETQITSFGMLTLAGIVATVLGVIMLFDSPIPALRVSLPLVLPLVILSSLLFAVAIGLSVKTLRSKPSTGREGMLGLQGEVRTALAPEGQVEVHGEIWKAVGEGEEIGEGETVEVVRIDGLRLFVRKV